ncbi:hypothetical protein MNV49_004571 [Pseudohyphozyma bogoriensis]|nr:hypothetical protein MNV49_004571 [Pseudohyphozyma bogoriensis]
MFFNRAAILSVAALVGLSAAGPIEKKNTDVHCGTTSDATLSDCQTLTGDVDTWNAAFNWNNVCHFTNVLANVYDYPAYNAACFGNCCVYVTGPSTKIPAALDITASSETIRQNAAGLLGCGDTGANKVNAMQKFDDGHAVCVSDGNGCGDCFDDSDYAF